MSLHFLSICLLSFFNLFLYFRGWLLFLFLHSSFNVTFGPGIFYLFFFQFNVSRPFPNVLQTEKLNIFTFRKTLGRPHPEGLIR